MEQDVVRGSDGRGETHWKHGELFFFFNRGLLNKKGTQYSNKNSQQQISFKVKVKVYLRGICPLHLTPPSEPEGHPVRTRGHSADSQGTTS